MVNTCGSQRRVVGPELEAFSKTALEYNQFQPQHCQIRVSVPLSARIEIYQYWYIGIL